MREAQGDRSNRASTPEADTRKIIWHQRSKEAEREWHERSNKADARGQSPERHAVYSSTLDPWTKMTDFRQEFLAFALTRDALRFGDFVTKAGRKSPYFFNAGLFSDGESLRQLGRFYANALLAAGIECD